MSSKLMDYNVDLFFGLINLGAANKISNKIIRQE